jgi:hypothetical protein
LYAHRSKCRRKPVAVDSGRAVIQQGVRVFYRETHILLEELADATLDGTRKEHVELMTTVPLLIVDDLGMKKLPSTAAEDLLERVMRRHERASTLFTSNRPVEDWRPIAESSARAHASIATPQRVLGSGAMPVPYEIPIRYLARTFVPAGQPFQLEHTAELVRELTAGAPTLLQEVQQIDITSGLMSNRAELVSADRVWQVDLPGPSLDVAYQPRGTQVVDFAEFCRRCAAFYLAILTRTNVRSNRLALVQEGLLGPMSDDALVGAARRLLRLPPPFTEHEPFEWDWRCASTVNQRIGGDIEPTNTIATVKRVTGTRQGSNDVFDRIRVDIDVNTPPSRAELRFDQASVQGFYNDAGRWHADVWSGICVPIFGGVTP